jgi:hypothetical protein
MTVIQAWAGISLGAFIVLTVIIFVEAFPASFQTRRAKISNGTRDYRINAIGLSALLTISSNALATESANYTIQISGYVPVICRVTSSARNIEISGQKSEQVQIEEFCNNSQGYQVWLDHEPNSGATVYVDGKAIWLSEGGSTMIRNSDRAALETHSLSFEIGESEGRLPSVSMRIVPL